MRISFPTQRDLYGSSLEHIKCIISHSERVHLLARKASLLWLERTRTHTGFKLYGLYCFRLLVGAPAARTAQPGVNRPGGVFKCEISRDDSCQEIPFDRKGQLYESRVFVLGSKIWALSKNSPTRWIEQEQKRRVVCYFRWLENALSISLFTWSFQLLHALIENACTASQVLMKIVLSSLCVEKRPRI